MDTTAFAPSALMGKTSATAPMSLAPRAATRGRKKRARAQLQEDDDLQLSGDEQQQQHDDIFALAATSNATQITKSQEVHFLRAEVKKLEAQHLALVGKWCTEITDEKVLRAACAAATQRWITSRYEAQQKHLKSQLLLQQLCMASLQRAMTESPMWKFHMSKEVFDAVHEEIHLRVMDGSEQDRMQQLLVRSDIALRLTPSLVNRFTDKLLYRATTILPFSTSSISADGTFTYMANVSVIKIEGQTVKSVFAGVLEYFGTLNERMSVHYQVTHKINRIHTFGPLRNYSQLHYSSNAPFSSISNTVFAASLKRDMAVIAIDFVDSDDMFPELSERPDRLRQRRDVTVL
uniref:Uncharacterized protein n=1 Tax=Globisporangium ultimum (strain ATCC 200006 / CBS 805.95 / DAOM BR144) TaxID=431595 RepID=K3X3A8_GLOUD